MPSRLFNSHPDHGIRVPGEVVEAYRVVSFFSLWVRLKNTHSIWRLR